MTNPKNIHALDSGWKAQLRSGKAPIDLPPAIPAVVPGSIHTDLMAAGLIDDPFLDDNERLLAWIGYCDWSYALEFDWQGSTASNTDLVFEGVDTVADLYLNGELIQRVANQHRSYRFSVAEKLKAGTNLLEVRLQSAIKYADRMSLELGYRPHVNHHPYNAVRKMAANFGWDWGIDTSTVGLWKPVYLESYDVRIQGVRPVVSMVGSRGVVEVNIDLTAASSAPLTVQVGDQTAVISSPIAGRNVVRVEVDNPLLWCPNGSGEAHLYPLKVVLGDAAEPIDHFTCQVGFRTVELKFPKSEAGQGFEFHVNGAPLYIRGVNWIPNDAFVHRITKDSLRERLTQAKRANINLIRVWGGGLYESDDFYEVCNELGLMVWQDFLFACASYSEEGLGEEVEAEARENISRIMKHPALVLWNGNNENLWGHQEWNWQQRLQGKSWGAGFYFDLLPKLVTELDPGRSYTPGSPYSPDPDYQHNDPNFGSVHIWDLWNQKDYPHYRDYRPRFVAEFGWQGPANWATITEAISDNPLTPESPGMIIHQKAMSGNDKLTDGLVNHFELPNTIEDWHWAMQLNQANAIRFGLEHMRSEYPKCMGSVIWQLNDCWPVTSWAAIDGEGREKPLYFSIAQSYEPLLITVFPEAGSLEVSIVNNSLNDVGSDIEVELMSYSGEVIDGHREPISVAAGQNRKISLADRFSNVAAPEETVLSVKFGSRRAVHFFADYKHSNLERTKFESSLSKTATGAVLTVTAKTLIRDLTLMIDKLDPAGSVDKGLVTLLPGETAEFEVTSERELSISELTSERLLRSANQLVVSK
jgi:beta-mannosidase